MKIRNLVAALLALAFLLLLAVTHARAEDFARCIKVPTVNTGTTGDTTINARSFRVVNTGTSAIALYWRCDVAPDTAVDFGLPDGWSAGPDGLTARRMCGKLYLRTASASTSAAICYEF